MLMDKHKFCVKMNKTKHSHKKKLQTKITKHKGNHKSNNLLIDNFLRKVVVDSLKSNRL